MATFFYRQKHSRRRLAALNFLSNISLDGSLHDNSKCESSSKANSLRENFTRAQESSVKLGREQVISDANLNEGLEADKRWKESATCSPQSKLKLSSTSEEKRDLPEKQFSKIFGGNTTANRERFFFSTSDSPINNYICFNFD